MKTQFAALFAAIALTWQAEAQNNKVCYEILDSWWETRESQKTRQYITDLDEWCNTYTGDPSACNVRTNRGKYVNVPDNVKNAACTTVGAHNHRCIGNPCNQLNTGDCTLQSTQGQCRWYNKAEVKTINAYYKKMGIDLIPGSHGCYRNACNQPGYGKLSDATCESYGVPNVFECTWCKGQNDPKLKGKGMGCQMTVFATTADCSPVNNPTVEKSSIYWDVNAKSCQCSDTYYLCKEVITSRSGYKPRF